MRRRRGGFCYELNGLFAALLGELGHDVTLLSAFDLNADGSRAADFDHMRLLVDTDAGPVLAEVGNGGRWEHPVPLVPGEHGPLMVRRDDDLWWTGTRSGERWQRGLALHADPARIRRVPAPLPLPGARSRIALPAAPHRLARRRGRADRAGQRRVQGDRPADRSLSADEELAVLAERFGIVVPAVS